MSFFSARLALLLAASALVASCGGGGAAGGTTPPTPPAVDTTAPSVPLGVTTSAVSSTSITLSWSASTDNTGGSGLRGYRVFRDGVQIADSITATTYSDASLSASTRYSYTVRAVDNSGNVSADSAASTATTAAPISGLDARPSNASCLAPDEPVVNTGVGFQRAFTAWPGGSLMNLIRKPGDSAHWYAVIKEGLLYSFTSASNGADAVVVGDLRSRITNISEGGFIDLAFDPAFSTNNFVYISYTAPSAPARSTLSRMRMNASGNLDLATEQVLITVEQRTEDHMAGHVTFGPDGMLYWALGDGDSGDPLRRAQNLRDLHGKLLRIDVSASPGYRIPAGNPYASSGTCPSGTGSSNCAEIYASGFRNPWRYSFDREARPADLWLGDVGEASVEEVNRVVAGGNYGWSLREGTQCYQPNTGCGTTAADGSALLDPLFSYPHSSQGSASVTGGFVYRGTAMPALRGRYIFGDFTTGQVFALAQNSDGSYRRDLLFTATEGGSNIYLSSFFEDTDGELYFAAWYTGNIYKVVAATSSSSGGVIPTQLSQTGCVASGNATQPASGLIPYAPRAPFWSDAAQKDRWMALPNGTTITVDADGDWSFPNGTVLMKNFKLNGQLVETRLMMRHRDTGNWAGYSYKWNSGQTDATLVQGGTVATYGTQEWVYPSGTQCMQCHTSAAGRSLGLETGQLNGNLQFPATGRTANQLTTFESIGLFSAPLPAATARPAYAQLVYPDLVAGGSGTIAEKARAYLHSNCSQCHRPGGGTPVDMDFRISTPVASMNICSATPRNALGIAGVKLITPGDPDKSLILNRLSRRDAYQMPPLGSTVADTAAQALVRQWITAMNASCQ